MTFPTRRQTLPATLRMTFGFRCYSPAHPRNRPLCLFVFLRSYLCLRPFRAVSSRSRPGLQLRLASSPPSGTFHPDSYHTCQAHERGVQPAGTWRAGGRSCRTWTRFVRPRCCGLKSAPPLKRGARVSTRREVASGRTPLPIPGLVRPATPLRTGSPRPYSRQTCPRRITIGNPRAGS